MKHFIHLIFLLCLAIPAQAQFGITFKQNLSEYKGWDDVATNALRSDINVFTHGQELGIDYWFRLKNQRIEFQPQLAYSRSNTNIVGSSFVDGYALNRGHFNLNTNFYFLDFLNDCDCPTFSKQGNGLTKGLFLQVSPGLVYSFQKINYLTTSPENDLKKNLSYKIGLGLGIDIGITDLFTVTPFVGVNYYPGVDWENFDLLQYDAISVGSTINKTSIREIQFGVRVGLRPDYKPGF